MRMRRIKPHDRSSLAQGAAKAYSIESDSANWRITAAKRPPRLCHSPASSDRGAGRHSEIRHLPVSRKNFAVWDFRLGKDELARSQTGSRKKRLGPDPISSAVKLIYRHARRCRRAFFLHSETLRKQLRAFNSIFPTHKRRIILIFCEYLFIFIMNLLNIKYL